MYPEAERAAGIEADVSVPVYVNAAGEVYWTGRQPASPFLESAVAAVRRWRYEPSDAVVRSFSARVRFRLPDKPIHSMPVAVVFERWLGEDLAVRAEALRELGDRGSGILPFLAKELRGPDLLRRCGAAHLASGMGRDARGIAPVLVVLVHETARLDKALGWCPSVAGALASVEPMTFTGELDRAVQSGDARLCRELVHGTLAFEEAPPAALAALLLDGCSDEAAMALPFKVSVRELPGLLRATHVPAPVTRRRVVERIGRGLAVMTGAEKHARTGEAMPFLLAALTDADRGVRFAAADAFATLGADAAPAVPALARLLEDPSRTVRGRVLFALTKLASTARAARPALLKAATDPLPPEEDPRTGLDDEAMKEQLQAAIAATGAGKDDARLAAEDEIRAAVTAYILEKSAKARHDRRPFAISVLQEASPPGLVAALARRGLSPSPGGWPIAFEEVIWSSEISAEVLVTIGLAMESSWSSYTVALYGGSWSVVGVHPRGIA